MEINQVYEKLKRIDPSKIIKLILSNKREKIFEYNKTVIKCVKVKGRECLQCESFTDKQAFHKTIEYTELFTFLENELSKNYKQLDGILSDKNFSLKLSKKNKVLYTEKQAQKSPIKENSLSTHNREKNYILKAGTYVPALYELGVITQDGKVINSQFDKFKQINRFVEIIDDSLKSESKDCLNIIDFGCGKSYLTFVLYHYLTEIKKIKTNIVGLDLKKDVIEKCNKTAEKYGYENLHFFCGDIKDYKADFVPDVVITLHACDTATDYALYNSITWGAKYIFSVPCCQHEINSTLTANSLTAICDYGIIKERFSSLLTDTIRCKLLEYSGYKVDLMEFIDIAHSPKNLLIRAKKSKVSEAHKKAALDKIEGIKNEFDFKQTLYNLLIQADK